MTGVLTVGQISVRADPRFFEPRQPQHVIHSPAGHELARAVGTSNPFTRAYRTVTGPSHRRHRWNLLGSQGRHLATIDSPPPAFMKRRIRVTLPDGAYVGHVSTRWTRSATFKGPDGMVLAQVSWALRSGHVPSVMHRIEAGGTEVGRVLSYLGSRDGYDLEFAPSASVAVRMLAIAWALHLIES